jgi:hypothetical protein
MIAARTKVLFEIADPRDRYLPLLAIEGRVMSQQEIAQCGFPVRQKLYNMRPGFVAVYTGIYAIPKLPDDVYVVRESSLVY